MDSSEKWYSISEVAFRYRVSRDTIIRRIESGALRALVMPRISGKRHRSYKTRLVSESELLRFERANMTA
jgi:hypothetical protein